MRPVRVRGHLPAGLRGALDTFLAGLVWDLPGSEGEPRDEGDAEPWYGAVWVYCPPQDVPVLARAWAEAGPRLEALREPFGLHAAAPGRWVGRFEEFAALLQGWAEVVDEARCRGWGLIGLPF
ncbi:hypothetical protein [Streptomyces hesseae]|uniref:Barstar (barnase inhibitor) domain-containing protein n=1 Tax=Streptomyces hesseae TaxID=3075519 RepID=A0ABU2SXR6_9ACTN|nr:hypothetical protein [Streptomyces sp. DSM 40473]MDT0453637.1 hypothetical protein [Streptomyces sp. DSM 40473]